MYELGFKDEIVERSILIGGATSIEEIMHFILPDEKGLLDHEFVSENNWKQKPYCELC
jgi:hypothetical protein